MSLQDALEGAAPSVLADARRAFLAYHEDCNVGADWTLLSDLGKLAWVRVVLELRENNP